MIVINPGHKELDQVSMLGCCWPPGFEQLDMPTEDDA
jgi:hypothetical protein